MGRTIDCESGVITLNATRVSAHDGLRVFTEAVAECLSGWKVIRAVVPRGHRLGFSGPQSEIPAWAASRSRISFFRPVAWLVYAAFFFPTSRKAKILSTTHHVVPFRRRQIATVHDLRPYFFPDSTAQRIYYRHILPRALRRCDGVLTVSQTSKKHLIDVYHLSPVFIHVVPNAVDTGAFFPDGVQCPPAVRYLLAVGGSVKHKNIVELLRNYRSWLDRYRVKIVAGRGQYLDRLKEVVRQLSIVQHVDFYSNVTKSELLTLYQNCSALVYPSLMEGFGIPPLEAMACGRPVIVSDIPVFREVYKDAPLFVKLGSRDSWDACISEIDTYAAIRIRRGLDLAKYYSRDSMCAALRKSISTIWGEGADEVKA